MYRGNLLLQEFDQAGWTDRTGSAWSLHGVFAGGQSYFLGFFLYIFIQQPPFFFFFCLPLQRAPGNAQRAVYSIVRQPQCMIDQRLLFFSSPSLLLSLADSATSAAALLGRFENFSTGWKTTTSSVNVQPGQQQVSRGSASVCRLAARAASSEDTSPAYQNVFPPSSGKS